MRDNNIVHIYIPLCFYFIEIEITVGETPVTKFTFHYASTLSARPVIDGVLYSNLHSTMLLLYPVFPDCASRL